MLAYPKHESHQASLPARIIGVGNAGVHLADRVAMNAPRGAEIVAVNSDAQSLAASVAPRKSGIGPRATRGLGAGGDPEVGFNAAQESIEELRFAVEGAPVVVIVAGLGGGTGSGAAPVLAEAAREAGAFVLALVTMPFAFEGRRRAAQAGEAVSELSRHAHAVLRFDNDRMADLASPRAGLGETFSAADSLLSESVISFLEMIGGRGPMPLSLGGLLNAIGSGSPAALFGRGEATGDNRAHEAIEGALKSPLLDKGRRFQECRSVVVHVSGPPSLSFSETAAIMAAVGKHIPEESALFLGVSVAADPAACLAVTLLAACGGTTGSELERSPARSKPQVRTAPAHPHPPSAATDASDPPPSAQPESPKPPGRLFADDEAPAAAPAHPKSPEVKKPASTKPKQEVLQFEPVARGRFEKSEPTIVEGQDLDVPTFVRLRGTK